MVFPGLCPCLLNWINNQCRCNGTQTGLCSSQWTQARPWLIFLRVSHWRLAGPTWLDHTPNIAFRHLPPNPAVPDLVTPLKEHFISAPQLSTDAVSALRKVRVTDQTPSTGLRHPSFGCRKPVQLTYRPSTHRKHEAHPPWVKKERKKEEFRLDSNNFGFIWASVSNVVSYKTNVWYNLSCLNKLTNVWAPTKYCSLSDSFLEPMA